MDQIPACKTVNLQDNVVENLDDHGLGNDFLDMTPKTESMKERIDNLGIIKFFKFLLCKRHCQENEEMNSRQKTIFAKQTKNPDTGLLSKVCKKLLKQQGKKENQRP